MSQGAKFQKASLSTGWATRFLALGGEGTPSPSFNRRYGALGAELDGMRPILPSCHHNSCPLGPDVMQSPTITTTVL